MVRHIARGIALNGPVHSWWMYVYERMNSWMCRRVTNGCHPEANVMETYRVSCTRYFSFMCMTVSQKNRLFGKTTIVISSFLFYSLIRFAVT